jgi:hypothetical protein
MRSITLAVNIVAGLVAMAAPLATARSAPLPGCAGCAGRPDNRPRHRRSTNQPIAGATLRLFSSVASPLRPAGRL